MPWLLRGSRFTTLRDGPREWRWRIRLAAADLAVSGRSYQRRVEADHACASFVDHVGRVPAAASRRWSDSDECQSLAIFSAHFGIHSSFNDVIGVGSDTTFIAMNFPADGVYVQRRGQTYPLSSYSSGCGERTIPVRSRWRRAGAG